MYLFQKHPITYTPVTEIEIEEWKKPDLLVVAFLGPAAIPLLIKAFYGQYLGLVGDEPEHSEESTIRNEPKVEEPASCGGDKEGPAPATPAPAPAADLSCPYNSAATAGSGLDADADSGSDPDVGDTSATSRPPCPRCSCSCNNNDEEEDNPDREEDGSSNSTNSANSEPKETFQSVVFFTLQSFPEALRAVERNLVYNFGPLR